MEPVSGPPESNVVPHDSVLREEIREKQTRLQAYIQRVERRSTLLNTTNFVSSGLAGLLAAGAVVASRLPDLSAWWRFLCLAAAFCSGVAAFCAKHIGSAGDSDSLSKARKGIAKLETLEMMLDLQAIPPHRAVKLYGQAVEDLPT